MFSARVLENSIHNTTLSDLLIQFFGIRLSFLFRFCSKIENLFNQHSDLQLACHSFQNYSHFQRQNDLQNNKRETEREREVMGEDVGTGRKLTLTLQSEEGITFEVSQEVASMSRFCKDMVEHEDAGDQENLLIPLPEVKADVLEKIINYMEYHYKEPSAKIERPLKPNTSLQDIICDWDQEFLDCLDTSSLFNVMKGANYMDIQDLLDLTCAKVASLLEGKTPEKMREFLGLEEDMTPEEKEKNAICIEY